MEIKRLIKLGSVTLCGVTLLAGCGSSNSSSKQSKQTMTWMQVSNMPTMDISKSTDMVSAGTLNGSNEGLLRMAEHNQVVPGVAKSYRVSNHGLTWTFTLRHSKWNDGTPVTAQDFVYSWQRTVNPKTASEYAYIFDHVKNANAINAGKMQPSKLGVKAAGQYKLVVSLTKPQSYFKYLVAQSYYFPQKKSVVDKFGSKYGTTSKTMVYNGPFKLTGWTGNNDSWTLVKNKHYWNQKAVKPAKIKFQVVKDPATGLSQYQSHKLDVATLSGQQVKQFKNSKQLVVRKNAATWYLEMNQKKYAFFRNRNIRRAISLIINRQQFTDKVLADGSVPAKGFVAANMSLNKGHDFADEAYVKGAVTTNRQEALSLWKKGLKETGKKSVSFNLLADDTDIGKKSAEYVQSELTKLPGLKITNQNLPYKTRLTRSSDGDFDMVISGWTADFPDPITFLTCMTSNNSYNNGKWQNKKFDKLVAAAEGKDANNSQKRWADMVNAEKVLASDEGIVPLYQSATPQLVKSSVKGIQFFPVAPAWDWSKVTVK